MMDVLVGLLTNAREAMPDGGSVEIALENVELGDEARRLRPYVVQGPYVRLSVKDDGPGMPFDVLQHAFEPFFTTKKWEPGAGLGLAMTYGIVKQHRGYVWIESAEGRGTTVMVHLPRMRGDSADALMGIARQATILLVEDDVALARLVERFLRDMRYRVIVANDSTTALLVGADRQEPIHIAIIDHVLPGPLPLVPALLAKHPQARILHVSGQQAEPEGEGVGFLWKPFALETLAQRVADLLHGPPAKP
jgi:CheY-like chemotaxis protein